MATRNHEGDDCAAPLSASECAAAPSLNAAAERITAARALAAQDPQHGPHARGVERLSEAVTLLCDALEAQGREIEALRAAVRGGAVVSKRDHRPHPLAPSAEAQRLAHEVAAESLCDVRTVLRVMSGASVRGQSAARIAHALAKRAAAPAPDPEATVKP